MSAVPTGGAVLVLEDGRTFPGEPYGAVGTTVGEAVFCTAMTGYQETITDPSYHRQVLVMTAPHIGNTGWNDEDDESSRIWVSGFVVRDPAVRASSWRSRRELADELGAQGVVGISGLDTRALTRHLRERGAMRVGVFSGPDAARAPQELLDVVRAAPAMTGADLAGEVTTAAAYLVPAVGARRGVVAALDLGIKANTPRELARRGLDVHVLPATATLDDVLALGPDGVFFSNGPGDPGAATHEIALLRGVLEARVPFFGICYGNQLLGRALGLGTYKLPFGHRGINQPVLDRAAQRVEITSQNHGFAVEAPREGVFDTDYGPAEVTHVSLNDGVVQGLRLLDVPAFSVQYHPEAAAGPHDANHLFDDFASLIAARGRDGHDHDARGGQG